MDGRLVPNPLTPAPVMPHGLPAFSRHFPVRSWPNSGASSKIIRQVRHGHGDSHGAGRLASAAELPFGKQALHPVGSGEYVARSHGDDRPPPRGDAEFGARE